MSLSGFIAEQQSPAEMAKSMGLQSDGSGGYIDPETGQIAARTVNNELVFYDPMGGAISAQSDGAELTQAQPSWRDPVTGEITVPPGQAESPEEIAAIPDIVPAKAPAGYSAFMNAKKKEMYANQEPPQQEEEEPQEEEPEMQPEMGMGEEVLTYKKLMEMPKPGKMRVIQDPSVKDASVAARQQALRDDAARRRAIETDRAAGNVRDDFQDRTTQPAPKPTPKVDTAAPVAPDIHAETSHQSKDVGAKIESIEELLETYGSNIDSYAERFRSDKI